MKLQELLSLVKEIQINKKTSTVYLVGGLPRDKYLNRLDNIDDLDFTTGDKTINIVAENLSKLLDSKYNINHKVMKDGHSSIFLGGLKLDFSSNFITKNIDSHLLSLGIKNPTNLMREMYSRDFTCNTLLLNLDLNKIYAPIKSSVSDLKNKVIKTCLPPNITLTTNKNRVVRAIYLSSKLDFDIDPEIINFVKLHPESILISSENSLKEKLDKAFEKNSDRAVKNLTDMNLWNHIPITDTVKPYYLNNIKKLKVKNVL